MIKLTRERSAQVIPDKYHGEKRITQAMRLMVGIGEKRVFDSSYWTAAKDQLKQETAGKCAYCEASVVEVAHGDVEHFRPKGAYWWIAYCYDNYLFACQICNQTYKGDNFPIRGTRLQTPSYTFPIADDTVQREEARVFAPDPLSSVEGLDWAMFAQQKTLEQAHLVNPYEEDPETLFEWEEASPGEIHIKAVSGNERAERALSSSKKYLGLNRDTLCKSRYEQYKTVAFVYAIFQKEAPVSPEHKMAEAILREAVSGDKKYTGMCRYFIRKVWGLPF